MKPLIVILALLGAISPMQAHQIWIEQPDGQKAILHFGEFGENLRETAPGLLDKFVKPIGTLISANGEQKSNATKTAYGFTLPFKASPGESLVAEDANYPLYVWKQKDKDVINWFYPSARFITSFAPQQPRLVLDLVPTGDEGQFRLLFKNQPKAKTKVTLVTQSGWSKQAHTDAQGLVKFDMPWKGIYVAEVSVNEQGAGERAGASGAEKYDAVSYVTTLTYVSPNGIDPIPPGPPATPNK